MLVGVCALWVARPLWALHAVDSDVSTLEDRVEDGDLEGAREAVDAMIGHAADARAATDGPVWSALERLPLLGDDASGLRLLSVALDQLVSQAPAGIDAVEQLSTGELRTADGGVDLDVVRRLEPTLLQLDEASGRASDTAARIDPDTFAWPLEGPVRGFLDRLADVRQASRGAVTATQVLPGVLGGEGARTYLLVVQNNAEIRSTGGLPGSASIITVTDGEIDLGEQGSAFDIVEDGTPIAPMLPGEEETFTDLLVTDFRDTAFTPDFPRAASLMAAYAEKSFGRAVDGVISVDPVTLAEVLGVTGPAQAGGRELTRKNAVRELLLLPYSRYATNPGQDRFFALAAQGVLDVLLTADDDPAGLVGVLGDAVAQRRLLFWSNDPDLQARVEEFPVAGALPGDTGRPEVGFYLDDSTQAKMQYFLRYGVAVGSQGCRDDGRQEVEARMSLRSTFRGNPRELAPSVVGYGELVPVGEMAMQLRIFAPVGGELTGIEVDGERVEVGQTVVYDRQSTQLRVQLAPGEETEVVATFVGAPGQDGDPRVQWTPSIEWGPTQDTAVSRC